VIVARDGARFKPKRGPVHHELFLPDARAAGDLVFRAKLPTAQGTSFPRPNHLAVGAFRGGRLLAWSLPCKPLPDPVRAAVR
jgi:hypothetical protein